MLGIKDMAGLVRPRAAYTLVKALKEETGLPVHFHTHDTSGIAAASVLAAIDAGADAVDGAIDAMSGLTSQPNLGSIVEALRHGPRDSGIDADKLRMISAYWEQVRRQYAAFESDIRAGASEVYVHGMPGGQYTNLREQARALGIDAGRWPEVARAYAEVNELFGDIIKVTPTSKAVGDLALLMVTQGLSCEQLLDPDRPVAFPESVVQLLRGELGQPYGGFPPQLQRKVLKGTQPLTARAGARPAAGGSRRRARVASAEAPAPGDGRGPGLLSHVPARMGGLRPRAAAVRRSGDPADAGVLLRHAAGAGDQHRPGARQDPHRALPRDERAARGRHAHGVLRAERPAALGARARSQPGCEAPAAAPGRARQCPPRRRLDARRRRRRHGGARRQGGAR